MAHLDQITSGPPSAIVIPRSMVQEHGCKTEAEAVQIIEGYTNAESEAEIDQIRRGELEMLEKRVRWKVDLRLCSIAGILCSLNLVDSGILSSAAVTSMLKDLGLDQGSRYSVSIFIFTLSSVSFQLPCTIAVRSVGPRVWFASITILFGVLTLCTAFVQDWQQMIVLRVLLGAAMSGIYPGLTYLISAWYPRKEQQLRFAFLQSGEVVGLATGTLVNYGVANLDGVAGFADWRWMFIIQGLISFFLGYMTYWWMIDFPENSHHSFCFLSEREASIAVHRIQVDRKDAILEPFSWSRVVRNFSDFKVYGFGCMFFLLNLVSTSLSYFLPTILNGLGFNSRQAILLATPVSVSSQCVLRPVTGLYFTASPTTGLSSRSL